VHAHAECWLEKEHALRNGGTPAEPGTFTMDESHPCYGCTLYLPEQMGPALLITVGMDTYATTDLFEEEASEQGVSRKIHKVPQGFKVGSTWVLLAHREACQVQVADPLDPQVVTPTIEIPASEAAESHPTKKATIRLPDKVYTIRGNERWPVLDTLEHDEGPGLKVQVEIEGTKYWLWPDEYRPLLVDRMAFGIFMAYKPTAIEYVVKGDESDEDLAAMQKRGITPVRDIRVDADGQEIE
jgi:hypothetical protein